MGAVEAAFWDERLQMLLARSFGYCEARSPRCFAPAGLLLGMDRSRMSIQHRRARGMGGTNDPAAHRMDNLLIVCGDGVTGCHGWIEVDDRAEAERRGLWLRHGVLDPSEVPVILPDGRWALLHPESPAYLLLDRPRDLRTYLSTSTSCPVTG